MLPSSNLLATSVVFLSASLLFPGHGVWASQLQEMEKPGKKPKTFLWVNNCTGDVIPVLMNKEVPREVKYDNIFFR